MSFIFDRKRTVILNARPKFGGFIRSFLFFLCRLPSLWLPPFLASLDLIMKLLKLQDKVICSHFLACITNPLSCPFNNAAGLNVFFRFWLLKFVALAACCAGGFFLPEEETFLEGKGRPRLSEAHHYPMGKKKVDPQRRHARSATCALKLWKSLHALTLSSLPPTLIPQCGAMWEPSAASFSC